MSLPVSDTLHIASPAKVNLSLEVLEKRPDGYHNIHTLLMAISLCDEVVISRQDAPRVDLDVDGGAPEGPENLVYRAAEAVRQRSGGDSGLSIRLVKRIPMQAGLGGGSSNAAAALRGSAKLLGFEGDILELASGLGSDVPFFLCGGLAEGRGRGEELEAVRSGMELYLLLVKPECGVPTGWAYEELDRRGDTRRTGRTEGVREALEQGDRALLVERLSNDFEDVVLRRFSEIRELRDRLLESGAEAALLCGSGSALLGVYPSAAEAEAAAAGFADVWHVSARGPVELVDI